MGADKFRIDYSDEKSLHNWIEQMNLYCTETYKVGFIGSSFFIGAFLGSFILPRMADIKGRKPIFLVGLILYFIVVIMTIFNKNLYLAWFNMFLGGISETGRYYVAYVYIVEMMPNRL